MRTNVQWLLAFLLAGTVVVPAQSLSESQDFDAVAVVKSFEKGIQKRDLKEIEKTVSEDIVAFENGHRNDGWRDFRDNHLVPELQEPAPAMKSEVVKSKTTPQMAWVYTHSEFPIKTKAGNEVKATLWSIYVLERQRAGWKIVLLDWSMRVPR